MARNSIGQFQEGFEPGFFCLSVNGDFGEVIGSADDSEDADEDDIAELMKLTLSASRVGNVREMLLQLFGINCKIDISCIIIDMFTVEYKIYLLGFLRNILLKGKKYC